jgi:cytochrome-b5 reductase
MRDFTKETLREFDGIGEKPVYICAKGIVYNVDKNFYGPEGAYSNFGGRDASRALALMSLDTADVEDSRLDDLSSSQLDSLEEWIERFEMKYQRVGFLVEPASVDKPSLFLKKQKQKVVLVEKIPLSHNTRLFRFALPDPNSHLGLPIGSHVKFWGPNGVPVTQGEWNGRSDPEAGKEEVERKYTPTTLDDERPGSFDVVLKVYKRGIIDRFPDGGKLSQHFDTLEVGDNVDVAGPFGLVEYKGKGIFRVRRKERQVRYVGMLAGGTGMTPMLQLIKAVLRDPHDNTKLSLIFANQTEDDILVRDMLDNECRNHPERFQLHYTLDRAPKDWEYSEGFVDDKMINRFMPLPGPDTIILMCGPPQMIEFACKPNLKLLGYTSDTQVEF